MLLPTTSQPITSCSLKTSTFYADHGHVVVVGAYAGGVVDQLDAAMGHPFCGEKRRDKNATVKLQIIRSTKKLFAQN